MSNNPKYMGKLSALICVAFVKEKWKTFAPPPPKKKKKERKRSTHHIEIRHRKPMNQSIVAVRNTLKESVILPIIL